MVNHTLLEAQVGTLREELQRAGHKATHQRLEVFREVIRSDRHPDAEMVFLGVRERIPTISRNTVYQTLQFLVDHGYIAPFGLHSTSHRYDRNTLSHYHLVCLQCHRVSDFTPPNVAEHGMVAPLGNWGRIDAVHVELRGVCADCLQQPAGGQP